MASLSTDKSGGRRILLIGSDGKRSAIRLGKLPKRAAETIKAKIEHLVASRISGDAPDGETSRWLASLDESLHAKLVKAELARPRFRQRLGDFLDEYAKTRNDVKGSTATFYRHTRRNLIAYFGAEKPLRDITPGDADKWRLSLMGEGLADNTVRRRCSLAKQFFRAALRQRLIEANPFEDLKGSVLANRSKDYFVSRDETEKVLEACPDAQWRLLFALSRFGGLRCPSEHLGLRWQDVDWERSRMTIHSPKTEHHVGKESRTMPLFPELRPYLEAVWDAADEGAEFVITRYRNTNANLRTHLLRIIKRAGLKAWPKLFQNLRSTRETELAEQYPMHVVCAWIGNSQAIAAKHYLQVTDEHFVQAVRQAAHNPAQQAAAGARTDVQSKSAGEEKPRETQLLAAACESMREWGVGDEGLEPPTSTL